MEQGKENIRYLNGHKGHLVSEGVYKVDEPFRINIKEWSHREENAGYSFIGTNYTYDGLIPIECDIVYIAYNEYSLLGNYLAKLSKSEPDKYGYGQSFYGIDSYATLGEAIIV